MKKIIKLFKFLIAITFCLFFYSCIDSSQYFEPASVTRTGGVTGINDKTKSVEKSITYANTSSKIKLLDSKYGLNGFMFMVEVPPNPDIGDKYKGDWDTESCYMIVLVPYATGTAYKNPESSIYSQSAYKKAKAAFDAGKIKQ